MTYLVFLTMIRPKARLRQWNCPHVLARRTVPMSSFAEPRWMLGMPLPGRMNDGFQVVVTWLPAELLLNFFGGGHQNGRISCASACYLLRDFMACNLTGGIDYLFYRKAFAISEIVDGAVFSASQAVYCKNMRIGQIGYLPPWRIRAKQPCFWR